MFSPALGATTAVWLLLAPVLELQSGPRSQIAVAVGVAALMLSPLGNWKRAPRVALAALGLGLGLVNFALPGSIGAIADFSSCAAALIIAGAASRPEVSAHVVPVTPIAVEPTIDESETPTHRLPRAA